MPGGKDVSSLLFKPDLKTGDILQVRSCEKGTRPTGNEI